MQKDQSRVYTLEAKQAGELLIDLLARNGLHSEKDCGGLGVCGKCKVKCLQGAQSPPQAEELAHLSEAELAGDIRLACSCRVHGEVAVSIPRRYDVMRIQEQGSTIRCALDPAIEKHYLELAPAENESLYQALCRQTGRSPEDALAVAQALGRYGPAITAVFLQGRLAGIEKGNTSGVMYGVAVDIGTTTVAAELIDLTTGGAVGTASMINPQFTLGSDVLSRIHFAQQQTRHIDRLAELIRDGLDALITRLFKTAGLDRNYCYKISIAGNTVMLHLLLGVDPQPLGRYPYRPVFLEPLRMKAAQLNLRASPFAVVQCLPGLSGFIGADITAGLIALDLVSSSRNTIFLDMGTNGEIVVCFDGRMMVTSTAAGPALEGMNISCGMKASAGAIESAVFQDGRVNWQTIGHRPPLGVCGSGLLDLVAALLKAGVIQKSGRIVAPDQAEGFSIQTNGDSRRFQLLAPSSEGKGEIFLTQQDVRQVQLAKGALAVGIKLLLEQAQLPFCDVQTVYLAGGFGFYLNADTLITLGLLPEQWRDRIVYVGNTSLAGARLAMLNGELLEKQKDKLKQIEYCDLNDCTHFNKAFSKAMSFSQAAYE